MSSRLTGQHIIHDAVTGRDVGKWASRPVSRVLCCCVATRRSFICIRCHHRRLATYPETRAGRAHAPSRDDTFPYLVLLRVGFTLPPALAGAVRSYHTFSPLPRERGGLFSAALSVDSRPPGVTWHSALWSPDFPPPRGIETPRGSDRPADLPANSVRSADTVFNHREPLAPCPSGFAQRSNSRLR